MTAYIILFVLIGLYQFVLSVGNYKQSRKIFLCLSFITLFIFCIIRDFKVGNDIEGYMIMYDITKDVLWNDWEYVYFEKGYIALMKLCNVIGLTARGFFVVVYAIIYIPIFLFVKKYSPYPFISVLFFLCFQFFAFNLTGLRQAIAMSLCLLAFMVGERKGLKSMILYILLVLVAFSIHKSSIIFSPIYFIRKIDLSRAKIIYAIIGMILCEIMNVIGVSEILALFSKDSKYGYSTAGNQQLGVILIFVILMTVCSIWAYYKEKDLYQKRQLSVFSFMLLISVCLLFLFNGSILLRASSYYYFIMIISWPIFLSKIHFSTRYIIIVLFVGVMLWHFFPGELLPFNLLPYRITSDFSLFR